MNSQDEREFFVESHLTVKSDHLSSEITHVRYPAWKNGDDPPTRVGDALLAIAHHVSEELVKKQNNVKSRVLIHCRYLLLVSMFEIAKLFSSMFLNLSKLANIRWDLVQMKLLNARIHETQIHLLFLLTKPGEVIWSHCIFLLFYCLFVAVKNWHNYIVQCAFFFL